MEGEKQFFITYNRFGSFLLNNAQASIFIKNAVHPFFMCACEMENEKVLNSKENSAERNCECLSIFRCTASQGLVAVDNHKFHSSEQYSSIYSIGQNISKPTIKIFYCTRTRSLCQWLPPLLASSKADNRWHNKCNKSTQSVYLLALLAAGSVLR